MTRKKREEGSIRSGNVRFADRVAAAHAFGFRLDRVSGSHHIFVHDAMPELLNLQDRKGKG
jgi:hypothetical protein